MDAELHQGIINDELERIIQYYRLKKSDVVLLKDNNPKHNASSIKAQIENNYWSVIEWPAQPSDMNPIEHPWTHVKQRLTLDLK
jgi:hypothetical protein